MNRLFSGLWGKWKRLWRRDPEPQDPHSSVRAPLKRGPRRGPHGRSSAVALAEPEEIGTIQARARRIF
jgi:hypothetical protein